MKGHSRLKPDNYSDMGRRILRFMATRGLNKSTLAQKIGINRSTLYEWMSGRTTPRIDQALKLATALGLISDEANDEQRGRAIEILYDLERKEVPLKPMNFMALVQSMGIDANSSSAQLEQIIMRGVALALAEVYLKDDYDLVMKQRS